MDHDSLADYQKILELAHALIKLTRKKDRVLKEYNQKLAVVRNELLVALTRQPEMTTQQEQTPAVAETAIALPRSLVEITTLMPYGKAVSIKEILARCVKPPERSRDSFSNAIRQRIMHLSKKGIINPAGRRGHYIRVKEVCQKSSSS